MAQLHILNGDAITPLFEQSGIEGEVFVWAEVLCEGRSGVDMTKEEHWQLRTEHLKATYDFYSQETFDHLMSGFLNLQLDKYEAIYLWFEYDLFCQINMMALLAWIYDQGYSGKTQLICVGQHPEYAKLVSLGELTPAQFLSLYEAPQEISKADLAILARLWQHWCRGQHDQLVELSQELNQEHFPYMRPALKAHLQRYPSQHTQLSEIESHILDLLSEQPMEEKKLIGLLLRREDYYGFGDVQYANIISAMKPLLTQKEGLLYPIEVEPNSTQVDSALKKERNKKFFGGAAQSDFYFDNQTSKLIKRS